MSKVAKVVIGFSIIFFLISLTAVISGGGLNDGISMAFMIFALSVICTYGISLVLWIPLCYGTGSLAVSIYESLSKSRKTDGEGPKSPLTNDQKALTGYIHQSRNKGVSDDSIFSMLKNNGWAENAIRDAFGLVESHKAS